MKNNFIIRIALLSIILCSPLSAMRFKGEFSARDLEKISQRNYLDNALSWTDQKINDLKQSIYNHPWRYAAGLTAAAAVIGVSVYAFKMKHVALPSIVLQVPSSLPKRSADAIEPIAFGAARAVSGRVAPALQQETPKLFLLGLRDAVENDLFVVECMKADRRFENIDLKSFTQITSTNYVAELHEGLAKIKHAFLFVAGFADAAPANMHDMNSLHSGLEALRAAIQEALSK